MKSCRGVPPWAPHLSATLGRPRRDAPTIYLSVFTLELFHKLYQRHDSLSRKSVIDRSADPTDRTVSFQSIQTLSRSFRRKLLLEVLRRQTIGYVHQRSGIRICMPPIKFSRVDRVVEYLRFFLILSLHGREAAFFFHPLTNETEEVNTPCIRSVIKRLILNVGSIIDHCMQAIWNSLQQIITQDHKRDAARPHILLCTSVD